MYGICYYYYYCFSTNFSDVAPKWLWKARNWIIMSDKYSHLTSAVWGIGSLNKWDLDMLENALDSLGHNKP